MGILSEKMAPTKKNDDMLLLYNWIAWTKMETFEDVYIIYISYKKIGDCLAASHLSFLSASNPLRWYQQAGDQKGAWRVGGT